MAYKTVKMVNLYQTIHQPDKRTHTQSHTYTFIHTNIKNIYIYIYIYIHTDKQTIAKGDNATRCIFLKKAHIYGNRFTWVRDLLNASRL